MAGVSMAIWQAYESGGGLALSAKAGSGENQHQAENGVMAYQQWLKWRVSIKRDESGNGIIG
jgi:hypothetical protein